MKAGFISALVLAALCAAFALSQGCHAPSPRRQSTPDHTYQPNTLLRLVHQPVAAGATPGPCAPG